jgi:hypothetical protein
MGIFGRADFLRHDGEFVAAEPADEIDLAHALLESRRDFGKQGVAGGMAERVVHVLEAIEVERKHRHQMPVPLGARHRTLEIMVELETVGKAGETVVHGEIANLILGQPPLADAPRGDRGGHREAHDDQKARGQGHHGERDIGQGRGGGLIDGEGVDTGELAVMHRRHQGEAMLLVAGQHGGHHRVFRRRARDGSLHVALREHGFERRLIEVAADGKRPSIDAEHGETVELANELGLLFGDAVQQPAGGAASQLFRQIELASRGQAGGKVGGLGDLVGETIGVQHVELPVKKLRGMGPDPSQTLLICSAQASAASRASLAST